jgi:hypothetical protein
LDFNPIPAILSPLVFPDYIVNAYLYTIVANSTIAPHFAVRSTYHRGKKLNIFMAFLSHLQMRVDFAAPSAGVNKELSFIVLMTMKTGGTVALAHLVKVKGMLKT